MKKLPESACWELLNYYRTAEKYTQRLDAHSESAYTEYVSFVRRFATKNDCLLDLGCGTGLSTYMLKRLVKKPTGVDISALSIQRAKEKYGGLKLNFICANVLQLPFNNASFDIASCFLLAEHIYDLDSFLSELVRVTKSGGVIIILSPNLLSPFAELYRLLPPGILKNNIIGERKKYNPLKAAYLFFYKIALLSVRALRRKESFCYRLPILENRFDVTPDNDAVYLANPLDLKFWFQRNGLKIIYYQRETIWGKLLPCFSTAIHLAARKA